MPPKTLSMEKFKALCIALMAYCGLQAQMTIKPAVGVNFTDFSKDPESGEIKSRVGYQVGGSVAFGKKFYLEPGIFWTSKSTKVVSDFDDEIKGEINGIRIPVAIGIRLLGSDSAGTGGLRIFGGGSAFFLTGTGGDFDKDEFEKAFWGVFAGVGIDFWKLFLDASYEWSLTNVQKDVQDVDVGKSRSIFINAGIRITL